MWINHTKGDVWLDVFRFSSLKKDSINVRSLFIWCGREGRVDLKQAWIKMFEIKKRKEDYNIQ